MTVTHPILRWHGGKWTLAPWIIEHFPASHTVYTECFGGAASVLLMKERSEVEVYNDLDRVVVRFFQVLRDDVKRRELIERVERTPYSREEYEGAFNDAWCPIEASRLMLVRSFQGFGGSSGTTGVKTGFRHCNARYGKIIMDQWLSVQDRIKRTAERLRGVVIENMAAVECIEKFDSDVALHYVDPPYVLDTRSKKVIDGKPYHGYKHELTDADHADLLDRLSNLQGSVLLSGYDNPLYAERLSDWTRVDRELGNHTGQKAKESLWLNPKAAAGLRQQPLDFGAA